MSLRALANFIVIILLASSAYAVVLVVERSQEPEAESSWYRQNEVCRFYTYTKLCRTLVPNGENCVSGLINLL